MSSLARKGTQDSLSSVNEGESDRHSYGDVDLAAPMQSLDDNTPKLHQRKKSENIACATTSHEQVTLQVSGASSTENTRSHTPVETPEHSPKFEKRVQETKSNSQVQLTTTNSLETASRSHSPTPSVINNLNNSRETSVEKCGDDVDITGVPISVTSSIQDNTLFPDNISRSSESGKSIDWGPQKSPEPALKLDRSIRLGDKKEKKKSSSWYNMLNPTYKSRSDDFKRLFKELPESERLIVDYSCALQKDILVHGRLYVSQNYMCFYANIFRWETFVILRFREVTSMTKEKTARVIPNAIQICTETEKHFLTSFGARDKTYLMLFRIWQNALLEQPMSTQELWQWVHYSYGEELGLTSDDDDYVSPTFEYDHKHSSQSSERNLSIKENGHISEKFDIPLVSEPEIDDTMKHDLSGVSLADTAENCESPDITSEGIVLGDHLTTPSVEEQLESLGKHKSSEYPTDFSDTTESEGGVESVEIQCPCATHEGKEVINTIFPLSVDQVFSLIFSGSKFFHELLASRKTYDILESPWQICEDIGHKMRQVTYTLTLNHSMAKCAQTTETQRLLTSTKAGQLYIVDCDVVNTGIPYSDTFSVKSYYCITRVSNHECRLRVHGCVRYKKSVWGLVKSLIEKSAMQGLADFCTDLEVALNKEAERTNQQHLHKKRRRKRAKGDSGKGECLGESPRLLQKQASARKIASAIPCLDVGILGASPDLIIKVILITLIVLLLLNVLLFYKLWSLEDQSVRLGAIPSDWLEPPFDSQTPLTHQDFVKLLHHQDTLHRTETERWRDALSEVIKLIRLVENSLSDLKNSIDSYSSASIFKSITLANSQTSDLTTSSSSVAGIKPQVPQRSEQQ